MAYSGKDLVYAPTEDLVGTNKARNICDYQLA